MDLRFIEIGNGCSTNGILKNEYQYVAGHQLERQINQLIDPTIMDLFSTEYSYAGGGNLLTMKRRGVWENPTGDYHDLTADQYGQIDNLVYNYVSTTGNGRRLEGITENNVGLGKALGLPATTSFEYDLLGNILFMSAREAELGGYNPLNLPGTMTVKGQEIRHTYDASGANTKIERVDGVTTRYGGPAVIQDDELTLAFSDGRILLSFKTASGEPSETPTGIRYQYKIKDHLRHGPRRGVGALRKPPCKPTVVYFEDLDGDGQIIDGVDATEVLQRELYYPFGLPLTNRWEKPGPALTPAQDFLYNGKEMERTEDLNLQFYGARWYDPVVVKCSIAISS